MPGKKRFVVRRSPIHGRGVFARIDIPAGARLLEYCGERISPARAFDRYGDNTTVGHTFLFTLNAHYLIDGNTNGNSARWINHSCDPNCEARIYVNINGDEERDRLFIESIRDIHAGEELSFDYGIELSGERHTAKNKKTWACSCGATNCSGTMLKIRGQ
jgi:uncharacterized protein